MQGTENTATLLGRIAMSLLFIHGGWGKLLASAATQAMLASHHLPMVKFGWILAVVVELGGGLAILLGLFTCPVGLVLAIPRDCQFFVYKKKGAPLNHCAGPGCRIQPAIRSARVR